MEKKKFLIIGHPRSGTAYMAYLFNLLGFNIGHETMGVDGISSWMFAVKANQVYTDESLNRKNFDFEYIIMNIRNPLKIVSSTYYSENTSKISLSFRRQFVDLANLNNYEMAVKSVVTWYQLIEEQKPDLIIKIDRQPVYRLYDFLASIDDSIQIPPKELSNHKVNTRKHPDLTINTLKENCQQKLYQQFINLYNRYEYNI